MNDDDASANNAPSEAMMKMLAPDGYYTYLNISKPPTNEDQIDPDVVKRSFRKLSLRVSGL